MSVRVLLVSALLLGLLCAPVIAQDSGVADTVYFGDNGEAWTYPGGVICLPVYITSDASIQAAQFGMEYGFDGYDIQFDSVSTFGTIFMEGDYMHLSGLIYNDSHTDGVNPDSVLIASIGFGNGDEFPPGHYTYAKVWFTAPDHGSTLTLDSAYVPPAGDFLMVEPNGNPYTPQFVGGALTLVEGPPEIYVIEPNPVSGDAATLITFDVSVLASYDPATIVLDSVINTLSGEPLAYVPATSGSNPLSVEWTPTYEEFGYFSFWFTATDAISSELAFSIPVTVNWVQPPCDVFRGDANCDDLVNVTDIVFLVQYLFQQGPAPGCDEP